MDCGPNIFPVCINVCRIMKGRGSNVVFNKKYCGKDTTSLKFTGDETVKLLFKVIPVRHVTGMVRIT